MKPDLQTSHGGSPSFSPPSPLDERSGETLYRDLVENANDIIFTLDTNGIITFVSPAVIRVAGYVPEDLLGRPFSDVIHAEDLPRMVKAFYATLENRLDRREFRYIHGNGEIRWAQTSSRPLRHKGLVAGMQGIFSDITERRRLDEALRDGDAHRRQLQKDESLMRMAGAIAHYYNNRMAVIMMNLESAMEELREEDRGHLAAALLEVRKSAEMGRLMLNYLGHPPVRLIPLDLTHTCRDIGHALVDFQACARIVENFPPRGPMIAGNAERIRQAVKGLMVNAVESLDGRSGAVFFSIYQAPSSTIHRGFRFPVNFQPASAEYACLDIRDEGCGIAESEISLIFEPFYSSKFMGRGLGLPVALGIVKSHHGCITVESAPRKGSAFRVYLPLLEKSAEGGGNEDNDE